MSKFMDIFVHCPKKSMNWLRIEIRVEKQIKQPFANVSKRVNVGVFVQWNWVYLSV